MFVCLSVESDKVSKDKYFLQSNDTENRYRLPELAESHSGAERWDTRERRLVLNQMFSQRRQLVFLKLKQAKMEQLWYISY